MNRMNTQMKALTKGLITAIAVGAGGLTAQAQLTDENVFLKGKYVEVGVSPIGACGSSVMQPSGYHGNVGGQLGFVADPDMDGFETGSPAFIGDYFLPGSPQEGWDIQVDGTRSQAWRANYPYGTTFTGDLEGENTGYYTEGSKVWGTWEGSAEDLKITMKTILDTTKLYFICEVVLKNTGASVLENIYYNRTVDPDNEQMQTGSFTTVNTVEFQPDDTGEGDQKCLVSGVGTTYDSYLGLGAVDCRAKAYIVIGDGLMPNKPLDDIYAGETSYLIDKDETNTSDVGIGVVWNIGNLNPGDSTTLAYAYILRQADLDSAFASLNATWNYEGDPIGRNDTIVKCWGAEIEMEIQGGGAYVWGDWVPNTGLSNPSGRKNTITVGHDVVTYRVIGTTAICPKNDTLYITIVPEGDSVIQNVSLCQGETYDFLGRLVYQTGTYYDVLSTSIGCDSVIQLNLTVNPLPNVKISARETEICEEEEALFSLDSPSSYATYKWYKDGYVIPGATQHTYVATTAGVYQVVGTTNRGCTDDSRKITLRVNPAASGAIVKISDQDVCYGDTVVITSDAKSGYQYSWSPEAYFRYTGGSYGTSANAVIPQATPIYLVSMNEYGCRDYDTAYVQAHPCCDIYIPTAFSPNGDGLNDEFMPNLRPGQVTVALQVFNRVGQLVYDNQSPQKGWNGLMNNTGTPVAQDVYMYRFVYTCTDGEVYETKGDIMVIR